MSPIIRLDNITHIYGADGEKPVKALDGVSLTVQPGEYVVILGHNGSGKSTLAKHLNALLTPTAGDVWVKAWNSKQTQHLRDIRSTVGMVFQTPDNQIVATIVEEDIAFGPENLGLPHDEIVRRVDWSLEQVGMNPYRKRAPHLLSGGQKQRIAIAGMLAMRPEVLVLDESTAMLEPLGRQEMLDIVYKLNQNEGVTVIAITHYMEEAVRADRLVIMENGRIVLEGTPRAIFAQAERLRDLHMDVPQITQLAHALHAHNPAFPNDVLTVGELVTAVKTHPTPHSPLPTPPRSPAPPLPRSQPPIIQMHDVGYFYMHDTPLQVKAIHDVTLDVRQGEIIGIIGHTGSGKSTIIQHFNALLRPHEGNVTIFEADASDPKLDALSIRRRIGFVFQQSEAQLFEHYVGDDIAYGPRNLKLPREEIRERVRRAMEIVGLAFEAFKDRITFSLSGGQMRRVAIAGVLALEPEALVLDEPTAGLDPEGRDQLLEAFLTLHREQNMTLMLVSHNMEELARLCHRICVINHGTVVTIGTPQEIFSQPDRLRELGLGVPAVTDAIDQLQQAGILGDVGTVLTVEEAAAVLQEVIES